MKTYIINANVGYGSMDRIYLEGWLLSNNISYKVSSRGLKAALTEEQVDYLRSEGWPVREA